MATVAELKPGQKGVIKEFASNLLPIKLLEFGCLPGNHIKLLQIAPLNDPLYVDVNGSHLAIRRNMAQLIEIDLLEDSDAL